MTTPTITCEQFADRLADFLERDVDEAARASMERHALGCIPCGELLADLRTLRIDAANLPALGPSRDLWAGIAERIETPVVVLTPAGRAGDEGHARRGGGTLRIRKLWIGAAAAALVISTAVITRSVTTRQSVVAVQSQTVAPATQTAAPASTTSPANATVASVPPDSVVAPRNAAKPTVSLVANRPSPEATYDTEIKRLRAIVAQRRSSLDTATINVIERNLQVIDDAISQCRTALEKDPASRFLMESLNDALDTKVQLLRTAAMLPART